jgi:hypothetical protein
MSVRPNTPAAALWRWRTLAITVIAAAILVALMQAPRSGAAGTGGSGNSPGPAKSALDRQGMWIWYVDQSHGGDLSRIIARARRSHIGTLYIKSGDSNDSWSQFNKTLVGRLHRAGLDVCAWQFVYGVRPLGEAKVGAASVRRGADCLVIDAEGQYEGKYASADRYIRALRRRIGSAYPLSLAGFPYVDYHPAFPYSVFLGPGGAQYSQPQMYWNAIGTSVRGVFEHTYFYNRVYERPIYPLGQTYEGVSPTSLKRFRRYSITYGDGPPSWWDWQETTTRQWSALGAATGGRVTGYRPIKGLPTLRRGSRGDLVVWAQQHLIGAGSKKLPVTGIFGKKTYAAVRGFQSKRGLGADGVLGSRSWRALLRVAPVRVHWSAKRGRSARLASASDPGASAPLSASLPPKRNEINPGPRP